MYSNAFCTPSVRITVSDRAIRMHVLMLPLITRYSSAFDRHYVIDEMVNEEFSAFVVDRENKRNVFPYRRDWKFCDGRGLSGRSVCTRRGKRLRVSTAVRLRCGLHGPASPHPGSYYSSASNRSRPPEAPRGSRSPSPPLWPHPLCLRAMDPRSGTRMKPAAVRILSTGQSSFPDSAEAPRVTAVLYLHVARLHAI